MNDDIIGGVKFRKCQKVNQVTYKDKSSLRTAILNLLRDQKEEDRLNRSFIIYDKLCRVPEYKKSTVLLFYASFDGEVDTFEMMKQAKENGKKISLPRVIKETNTFVPYMVESLESDLEDGPYGIKQPKGKGHNRLKPEDIDLVIVPGVAFDKSGHRLGRGGGYYDRYLKSLPSHTPTIGLAFDFQIVDYIPAIGTHDIQVSRLITN